MTTDDRILVRASHSHLFRGARLSADVTAETSWSRPAGLRIVFSDGSEANAELLRSDTGELAVDVDGYRTEAGAVIDGRAWRATALDDSAGSVLRIDGRI